MHPSSFHSKSFEKGFSLPEVAMSLGIAATALLTLVSLLPFGLNTLRDSGNKQAEARIVQSVIDGYQTGDWMSSNKSAPTVPGGESQDRTFFFDQTGTELEDASDVACNYVVRALMGSAPSIAGDVSENEYLRQLKVRITDRTEDYEKTLTNDVSGQYRERNVWIAMLEQTGPLSSNSH